VEYLHHYKVRNLNEAKELLSATESLYNETTPASELCDARTRKIYIFKKYQQKEYGKIIQRTTERV